MGMHTRPYNWVLKNFETGEVFPRFTYKTREAARKAAKGRRFKGQYRPFKLIRNNTVVQHKEDDTIMCTKKVVRFKKSGRAPMNGHKLHQAKRLHQFRA